MDENEQNDKRKYVRYIHPSPFWKVDSLSCIRLFRKVLPAPANFAGTEQKVNQTADRKKIVAHKEILQIQDILSLSQRLETAPQIESEDTRQGQKADCDQIDQY